MISRAVLAKGEFYSSFTAIGANEHFASTIVLQNIFTRIFRYLAAHIYG